MNTAEVKAPQTNVADLNHLEPFREVWSPDQRLAATLRSMMRIMARRTNAAALRA
jgi:hypothetical protein